MWGQGRVPQEQKFYQNHLVRSGENPFSEEEETTLGDNTADLKHHGCEIIWHEAFSFSCQEELERQEYLAKIYCFYLHLISSWKQFLLCYTQDTSVGVFQIKTEFHSKLC